MKENSQVTIAPDGTDDLCSTAALGGTADPLRICMEPRRGPQPSSVSPLGAAWEALAEGMPDGILVLDACGLVVARNRRFRELWGLAAAVDVGASLTAVGAALGERLCDPACAVAWLASPRAVDETEHFQLKDGRILEGRFASGAAQADALRVWSFRDVTDREHAMQRTTLLAEAGRLLISLDLDATLEAVARSALPLLGELCAVDRIADGRVDRYLEVRTEGAAWLEPPEVLASCQETEVRSEASRSRLTVPIVLRGTRCGALSLVRRAPGPYGARERALAQELADRLALAMDSAESYRQARQDLAEREELVFVAAHELRSPLASLRIAVETLRRKQPEGPRLARLLEVIDRDERRLTRMVGELLDLGRIRSGQLDMDLDVVDLGDVVQEAVGRMGAEIARSGSSVAVSAGAGVIGRWDRSRLDQVVTNLVGNAAKYGAGRPIDVQVDVGAGGCARLMVSDQGPGIPVDVQQRIFQPFVRAPGLREAGGLGLGLYIVQTIVQRLGGDVRVDSAPDHGATFTVELPMQ